MYMNYKAIALVIIIFLASGFNCDAQSTSIIRRSPPSQATVSSPPVAPNPIPVPVTSVSPPKKPITTTTTETDVIEETDTSSHETVTTEDPMPTNTKPSAPGTITGISPSSPADPIDPTDYSTVLPTRWRPRQKRFGAQGDAQSIFSANNIWNVIILNFAFIGGILLFL